MKMLVVQLSGLDEIYLTIPGVLALHAENPEAKIDFLVKKENRGHFEFLLGEKIHPFYIDDRLITKPVIKEGNLTDSLLRLKRCLDVFVGNSYDKVVNLSFTAVSSYVADIVAGDKTDVHGYKRTEDGFLAIPDDSSAYVFAQCGKDGDNRVHMVDMFSSILGANDVETAYKKRKPHSRPNGKQITINLSRGAAESEYESHRWSNILSGLLKKTDFDVLLIGEDSESETAERLVTLANTERVRSQIGNMSGAEMFIIFRQSRMLISTDGPAVALSAFAGLETVGLFFSEERVWEKGPRTNGSRALLAKSGSELSSDYVVDECISLLNGETDSTGFRVKGGVPYFEGPDLAHSDLPWKLIKSLYLKEEWPDLETKLQLEGFLRMFEINGLAYEQFDKLVEGRDGTVVAQILDRVDELYATVSSLDPSLAPLIRWYRTEKIRIRPGSFENLLRDTKEVHDMMNGVLVHYLDSYDLLTDADMEVRGAD